jgi:hypothetical protein
VQIGSVVIETREVKAATDSDRSLAPDAAPRAVSGRAL